MDLTKTPVSILQESMAKIGSTPIYEFIESDLNCTSKLFKCKVSCCDKEITGSGKSKKDAKQDAAKNMLLSLNKANKAVQEVSKTTSERDSPNSLIENDETLHNFVQDLQILCEKLKVNSPVYKDKEPTGPAHARIHSVQCLASTFVLEGIGKSKKEAKQAVAKVMIKKIENSLNSNVVSQIDKNTTFRKSTTNEVSQQSQAEEMKNVNLSIKAMAKMEEISALIEKCYDNVSEANLFKLKLEFENLLTMLKIDFYHMLLQNSEPEIFMLVMQLNTTPDILEMSLDTTREEVELRTIIKVVNSLNQRFK